MPQNILTSLGTPPDAIIASIDDMALGALEALNQVGIPKGQSNGTGFLVPFPKRWQRCAMERWPLRSNIEVVAEHLQTAVAVARGKHLAASQSIELAPTI